MQNWFKYFISPSYKDKLHSSVRGADRDIGCFEYPYLTQLFIICNINEYLNIQGRPKLCIQLFNSLYIEVNL